MAKLFTDEQYHFVLNNYLGISNVELTKIINKKFNTEFKVTQIKSYKKNHRLNSGLTGRFEKGHVPTNKGIKGKFNVGGNSTSFKKGDMPHNYKPIGAERILSDGYVYVKVRDDFPPGDSRKGWAKKHYLIWEEVNGPVPDGYRLLFLNGNRQDIRLDNLELVSNAQLLILNRQKLIKQDPNITKIGVTVAKIVEMTNTLSRNKND